PAWAGGSGRPLLTTVIRASVNEWIRTPVGTSSRQVADDPNGQLAGFPTRHQHDSQCDKSDEPPVPPWTFERHGHEHERPHDEANHEHRRFVDEAAYVRANRGKDENRQSDNHRRPELERICG